MDKPLVLWGGVDVDPVRYGEKPHPRTSIPDTRRDYIEFTAAKAAIKEGQPIIGVCRGAQLLCVLNGGKLHQHTVPHTQQHSILTMDGEELHDVKAGHHQIMIPSGKHITYAVNPHPVKIYDELMNHRMVTDTAEVVWFPDTKCLAIQPHPEWESDVSHPFIAWINNLIHKMEIDYAF